MDRPPIFPAPRVLELRAGVARLGPRARVAGLADGTARAHLGQRVSVGDDAGATRVDVRFDPSLRAASPERYTIDVEPDGVVRVGLAGEAAAHPALATLAQVLDAGECPALHLDDHPAFEKRGFMLDVSRDRVPTLPFLLDLLDTLASLKFNHFQLYTEHAFAYAGHEEVWRGCSPITPDDIRAIDARARSLGIELAANQNCFGHLARWLRLPRYAALAETHGEWDFFEFKRSGPFSLCPIDPGSIALVEDLLRQLTPHFSSALVNVGCDETVDVGQGRSREEVARRGRARVYLDFLGRIVEVARRLGRRPMFWGDIALSHPEVLGEIPRDLVALAWGYEGDAPFDRWCDALACGAPRPLETWVCPGTSSWRSIVGRTRVRDANIDAAGRCAGRARGLLLTDWGDMGHRQVWPISLPALARAAQAAWNPGAAFDARAPSSRLLGDASAFGWLDELGESDRELRLAFGLAAGHSPGDGPPRPLRNASALYVELHAHDYTYPRAGSAQDWGDTRARLDSLAGRIPCRGLARDELAHACRVASIACELGHARRTRAIASEPRRRSIAGALADMSSEHARLWAARSRPGGLGSSLDHYSRAAAWILEHG